MLFFSEESLPFIADTRPCTSPNDSRLTRQARSFVAAVTSNDISLACSKFEIKLCLRINLDHSLPVQTILRYGADFFEYDFELVDFALLPVNASKTPRKSRKSAIRLPQTHQTTWHDDVITDFIDRRFEVFIRRIDIEQQRGRAPK